MEYNVDKIYKCNKINDFKTCLKDLFKNDYKWHYKFSKTDDVNKFPIYVECWNDKEITVNVNLNSHSTACDNPKVIIFNSRKHKLKRILK